MSSSGLYIFLILGLSTLRGFCAGQLSLHPPGETQVHYTGASFFVTCVPGSGMDVNSLSWSSDDHKITETTGRVHIQESTTGKGLELVVEEVHKDDAGTYTCTYGEEDNMSFELKVYRSISFGSTEKFQYGIEGEDAQMRCIVKAENPLSVQWQYANGTEIKGSEKYSYSGEHDSVLTIRNVSRQDTALYRCQGFTFSAYSNQLKLFDVIFHVKYVPEFTADTQSVAYANIGQLANLSCTVSAYPAVMFQWSKDERNIYNSSDNVIINSANNSVLQLKVEDEDELGDYVCAATNDQGSSKKVITLKEGDTPPAPTLKVVADDKGTMILDIKSEEQEGEDVLTVTGFKVEYVLSSQPWEEAEIREFNDGEKYALKNVSYNSEYLLRAAAKNAAGYGDYSDVVTYKTQMLQVASVVSDGTDDASLTTSASLFAVLFSICLIWAVY